MGDKELAVGIDIGGTNTVFGFVDREGNILAEGTLKTAVYDEAEVFVAALYEMIMLNRRKAGNGFVLKGFGIGAPSPGEQLKVPQVCHGKALFLLLICFEDTRIFR
jgi:glucokinase